MTSQDSWHAASEVLSRYADGGLGHVTSASVEAHLLVCEPCRGEVALLVPADRLARNLHAIHTHIDDQVTAGGWVLDRFRIPDRISRILLVTPSARLAWLTAIALAATVAVLAADVDNGDERARFAFLVVAPLIPLGVVATTFAGRFDPVREVVAATPMPVFDLLLMRALAVLVPATAAVAVAALLMPHADGGAALWLLPSLALAATTLALATRIPVRVAAWLVGTAWVGAALISVRGAPRGEVIERYVAFGPSGQAAFAAVTIAAAAVLVRRRDKFEHVEQRRAL